MESQWNAEREAKVNGVHLEARAYPPKVTIRNDIFPRQHEIYNCTTCKLAEPEHPAYTIKNPDTFHVKCKGNKQWNEGPRFEDIACWSWYPQERRPRKGYTEGIDK
jgi:hypothetical protein